MNYQNPLVVLNLPADFEATPANLQRLQKRLLAEFELQERPRVDFSGTLLDRQELINLLDSLKDTERFSYHQRIAQNPLLLNFLSKGDLALFRDQSELPQLTEEARAADYQGFWAFLTPYFAERFGERLYTALHHRSLATAQSLLQHDLPIEAESMGLAYQKAYRYLRQQLRALAEQAKRPTEFSRNRSLQEQYIGEDWIKILNHLPLYFAELRTEYALLFEDLCFDLYQRYAKQRLARKLMQAALSIDSNESVQYRLDYLAKQMGSNTASNAANFFYILRFVLLGVGFFILLMVWITGGGGSSRKEAEGMRAFQQMIREQQEQQRAAQRALQQEAYDSLQADLMRQERMSRLQELQDEIELEEERIFMFDEGDRPQERKQRPRALDLLLAFHNENLTEELPDSLYRSFERPSSQAPLSETRPHSYQLSNSSQFDVVIFLAKKKQPQQAEVFFLPEGENLRIQSSIAQEEARLFYYAGKGWLGDRQFRSDQALVWEGAFARLHGCDPNGQTLRYDNLRFFP